LNRDTGLTGNTLESLTKTLLDASRLTGSDSTAAAGAAGLAMNTWGIAASDSERMLEQFFAASQAGGVNMGELMKKMGQFGDPLRRMGLSFEQSMVLMAKWQKQGISPIEDALKKPMGLGAITELSQKMKTAATDADAAALATQTFGYRVSDDMVNALRWGGVEFKGIMAAMNSSGGAIAAQSEAVQSFGDQWSTLSNRIAFALAPIGEAMLPFGQAMVSVLEGIIKYADILLPSIIAMSTALLVIFAPALWASAVAGWAAVAPFLPIIGIVALVGLAVAGLAYLFKYHMDDIKAIVEFVVALVTLKIKQMIDDLTKVYETVKEFFGFSDKVNVNVQGQAAPQPATGGAPLKSFYHGLDYVPYDGLTARLHKGERVLTASENRELSQSAGNGASISITGNTFNVRQDSDIDSIAKALAREIKAAGGLMA
jgi:hypothetical protein